MIALLLNDETSAAGSAADALLSQWPTLLVALVGVVGCALLLLAAARWLRIESVNRRQVDLLARIDSSLGRLAESHGDLELRRLEHVLIDIRDGQKRQEERLLTLGDAVAQARESAVAPERPGPAAIEERGVALRDRIVSRLLALGFERIELLASSSEIEGMVGAEGEVSVEARRAGAWHKGRVVIRSGSIADVTMRASFEAFP